MEKQGQKSAAQLLRKGLRELAAHRPDKALETLRLAVDSIPPACSEELSRSLYWLSVALLRLDKRELAVKSLSSAQKLRRRGIARRLYLRNINEYGMPKQPTAELDDFYAFMNIQLAVYLVKKPRRRFDSLREREAVFQLLVGAWKKLKDEHFLADRECGEKLALFRRLRPDMPSFGFGVDRHMGLRTVSFAAPAAAASGAERCSCGSGLPSRQCCNRVRSLSEL